MTYHDRLGPLPDEGGIDLAEACVPFLAVQRVDAGEDVLVPLIHTVAGEMLDGDSHAVFLGSAHISAAAGDHALRVAAEGAHVGDGVVELVIDIHDGGEAPVEAQSRALRAGGIAHAVGVAGIICRRDGHGLAEARALKGQTVAAVFRVGRQQQRDLCHRLNGAVGVLNIGRRAGAVHHAAHMQVAQHVMQETGIVGKAHGAEDLSGFFLQGHGGESVVHPSDIGIVQAERLCFQINHRETSRVLEWAAIGRPLLFIFRLFSERGSSSAGLRC